MRMFALNGNLSINTRKCKTATQRQGDEKNVKINKRSFTIVPMLFQYKVLNGE